MVMGLIGRPLLEPQMPTSWFLVVASGLLVGFGTRLGGAHVRARCLRHGPAL